MPKRPLKQCAHYGCKSLTDDRFCREHESQDKIYAGVINRASASDRGYNAMWQKMRDIYLRAHPLCVQCKKEGRIVEANVVDHIVPHRGKADLFWDQANWQSLCTKCHNRKTMKEGIAKARVDMFKNGVGSLK